VGVADRGQSGLGTERIVEVHGTAADNQKDVLDALFGDAVDNVIGELHKFDDP
jgi:hypothetical protein